jgi:glutathione S-transferase
VIARPDIVLQDGAISADCYKVRLLLGFLALPHRLVPVDPVGNADAAPVLTEDDLTLHGPQAILAYLAARHDATGRWFPCRDPALLGQVMQYLVTAQNLANTAGAARRCASFGQATEIEVAWAAACAGAKTLFATLDRHLWYAERRGQDWLCPPPHPTIADLACFPDVVLAEEAGIELRRYQALRRWTDRLRRLPGFAVMPGVFALQA